MKCLDLPLTSDVIETCLFVLWRHLEYYLLHYTPSDPKDPLLSGNRLYRSRLADGKLFLYVYLGLVLFLKSLSFFTDSFLGLQTSGGRGLGLSRVSQQDLDMVGKSLQLAVLFGWHSLAQVVCS